MISNINMSKETNQLINKLEKVKERENESKEEILSNVVFQLHERP